MPSPLLSAVKCETIENCSSVSAVSAYTLAHPHHQKILALLTLSPSPHCLLLLAVSPSPHCLLLLALSPSPHCLLLLTLSPSPHCLLLFFLYPPIILRPPSPFFLQPSEAGVVLNGMADPYQSLMLWLLDVCVEVSSYSSVNRMGAKNLAIVIAPNLFQVPELDPMRSLIFSQKVANFVQYAIEWRALQ